MRILVLLSLLLASALGAGEEAIALRQSVTTKPILAAAIKQFEQQQPGTPFASIEGLSAPAVKAVADGEAQLAAIVRDLTAAERAAAPDLVATPFCIDVLTLVVPAANGVVNLTKEQVRGLFTGGLASWKEVGGPDAAPVLIGRIHTFATLAFFEECFDLKRVLEGEGAARVLRFRAGGPTVAMPSSNDKALAAVVAEPAAVTFASLALVEEMRAKGVAIKTLSIDGVAPTAANAVSGAYAAKRPFTLVTKGAPQGRVKEFLAFLTGPGQKVVADKGFIPVR
jgi:phosphate transport system substrate-binding protein